MTERPQDAVVAMLYPVKNADDAGIEGHPANVIPLPVAGFNGTNLPNFHHDFETAGEAADLYSGFAKDGVIAFDQKKDEIVGKIKESRLLKLYAQSSSAPVSARDAGILHDIFSGNAKGLTLWKYRLKPLVPFLMNLLESLRRIRQEVEAMA